MSTAPNDVTRLLNAISAGETGAWEKLLDIVYDELRRLAGAQLRGERPDPILAPTALVHEAYLQLASRQGGHWANRGQFFAAAAEAMRRIRVDHARRRRAKKRGGDAARVSLGDGADLLADPRDHSTDVDIEALDEALATLEADPVHRDKATIVKLRFFAGMTLEEIARALEKSLSTVKRDWTFAKSWLYQRMKRGES